MFYLAAATAFASVLGIVNLVLVLAVLRRLRALSGNTAPGPTIVVVPGERPQPFTARTADGEPLDAAEVGGSLVGFLSPTCPSCEERLPQFLEYAQAVGPERAIAVLIGEPDELGALAAQVSAYARIVTEPDFGPVATAFAVKGYPAVCLLDGDGVVTHSGTDFAAFPPSATLRQVPAGV